MNYFSSKSQFYEKKAAQMAASNNINHGQNYSLNLTIIFFVYALLSESVTFRR